VESSSLGDARAASKNPRRQTALGAGVLACLVLIVYLSCFWQPGADAVHGPRIAAEAPEEPPEAAIRGWLAANVVYRDALALAGTAGCESANGDSCLDFQVTLTNESGQELSGLRWTDFQAPGFRPAESRAGTDCWRGNAPVCVDGEPVESFPALSPGGSLTISARLAPVASAGEYSLGGVLAWEQGGLRRSRAVVLGPVKITSRWREGWLQAGRAIWTGLAGLALPVAVVLLTVWFQRKQNERQQRAQEAERQREMGLKVWESELDRIHDYAEKYYLGIINSLRQFERSYEGRSDPDRLDEAVYWLLMYLRRWKRLRDEKGGIFFRDRTGERVVANARRLFDRHLDARMGKHVQQLERLLELFGPSDSREAVWTRLLGAKGAEVWQPARLGLGTQGGTRKALAGETPPEDCDEVLACLEGWLEEEKSPSPFGDCYPLLRLVRRVMHYEVNRPFQAFWYETPQEGPDVKELNGLGKGFQPLRESGRDENYSKTLNALLKNLSVYLGIEAGKLEWGERRG